MKRGIAFVLMAMLLLSFTACGNGNVPEGNAGSQQVATVAPEKKVTLKLWQWRQEIVESLEEVLDEYTKQNPHVTILSERPGGSQYEVTVKAMMASGENPDIFAVRAWSQTKEYAEAGQVLEFADEPFMSVVSDFAKETVNVNGKLYGLPMQVDGGGIIYNKKVFEEANIDKLPETITELSEVCEKLKEKGFIPFAAAHKDWWTLRELFSYLHTQSTDLIQFSEAMNMGNESFKNAKMDQAMKVIDIINDNCNEKPMDSDYNNACALIAQGKAGMMVQGLWSIPVIEKVNPDFDGGFIPVPISDTAGEARLSADITVAFHIYPESENIEESKKLLTWFTQKETAKLFAEKCGFLPPFEGAAPPIGGGSVWNDMVVHVEKGNVVPFGYSIWPTGFDVQVGQLMQGYCIGQYDSEQLYNQLDETWKSFIK